MSRQHHYLKILPPYFIAVEKGIKPFEVRFNDRGYKVGDILYLQEFVPPETYTGRELRRKVTYVLDDPAYCKKGFVVLGMKEVLTVSKAMRKPRPSMPRWFWRDQDGCWFCKNRNNCNQCKANRAYAKKYMPKKRDRVGGADRE